MRNGFVGRGAMRLWFCVPNRGGRCALGLGVALRGRWGLAVGGVLINAARMRLVRWGV